MTYDQNSPATTTPGTAARYNVLSIVGFILAFVFALAGLVVSIIAFSQIKKTGERGRGLALAGIILSIVFMVISIILSISVFSAGMDQMSTIPTN
jgi:preprotein translocase subunit SecG